MSALDRLIPSARLVEVDHVDVDAEPARVWADVRHGDLAASRVARALFALRTVADRLAGEDPEVAVRIDDMTSTQERPGFRMLSEDPGAEVVVGAIGKVWRVRIPFVHVADAEAFAAFDASGFVKVAWALRVLPRAAGSRVEIEVRVRHRRNVVGQVRALLHGHRPRVPLHPPLDAGRAAPPPGDPGRGAGGPAEAGRPDGPPLAGRAMKRRSPRRS